MLRSILFPLDFSHHAQRIVQHIPNFRRLGMEEAVLLHVINPIKAVRWLDVNEQLLAELKSDAETKLHNIAEELATHSGIKTTYRVEIGVTDEEIINIAEELSVSLIVMGSHGRSYVKGVLLGSVTQRVLRKTPIPLLIASFHAPDNTKEDPSPASFSWDICAKILYPTDFSENALQALHFLKKCHKEGKKEVIILHVQDSRRLFPYLSEKLAEFNLIDEERITNLKRQLTFVGYSVRCQIKVGIPFVEINKMADEENVTLIVLASHGKSNIKEALMGSVAEAVAQHHVRPVLIVPRKEN